MMRRLLPPSPRLRWSSAIAMATLAVLAASAQKPPAEFFVAPTGTSDGDGSVTRPWNLQTALAHPSAVTPGSTIWLRGGRYTGAFVSRLTGTADAYIAVRAYRGERPILDNPVPDPSSVKPVLTVEGAYLIVRDLEITSSSTARTAQNSNVQLRPVGINVYGAHTKLIDNIVHDTGDCIGHWVQSSDAEIYGNIMYFCGWDAPDRGHGHGLYVQNERGSKEIRSNIIFNTFAFGIHGYTESGALDDMHFRRNVVFSSAMLSKISPGHGADILVGGRKVAHRPIVEGNFTYRTNGVNYLGYRSGTEDAVVTGNYFVEGAQGVALSVIDGKNASLTGNTFLGDMAYASKFPGNTYYEKAPQGIWRFVQVNEYEPTRATVIVYNWDAAHQVEIDAPPFLARGDSYEIRNVQDYFSDVVSATYDGGPIVVGMTNRSVATPIGWSAPAATFPTFGVFVLAKVSSPPAPTTRRPR